MSIIQDIIELERCEQKSNQIRQQYRSKIDLIIQTLFKVTKDIYLKSLLANHEYPDWRTDIKRGKLILDFYLHLDCDSYYLPLYWLYLEDDQIEYEIELCKDMKF